MLSYVGILLPSVQYFGILFTFVLLADLPISLPAYFMVWKYPVLSGIWIFAAGTFWWYLIAEARRRSAPDSFPEKSNTV